MKRIYYPAGPPKVTAGIAGLFEMGKAKPVCNKLADQLLARPDFKEADSTIPNMDGYDQLLAEAEEQDKAEAADQAAAPVPEQPPQPEKPKTAKAATKEATE